MDVPKVKLWYAAPICAVVFFVFYFANGFISNPPVVSSDLAAWAQAFGAITGIAVAITIPMLQRNAEKRQRKLSLLNEEKNQSQKIDEVAEDLVGYVRMAAIEANAAAKPLQEHLPSLIARLIDLQRDVTRFTLINQLRSIYRLAIQIQNYVNKVERDDIPFSTSRIVFKAFEIKGRGISIEIHTTYLSFRDMVIGLSKFD